MYTIYKTTKVTIPIIPPNLMGRPRLIRYLEHTKSKKVTIVQAPAGYGKTSTVMQLLHAREVRFAWLSIDEMDNDIARFWSYFIKALRHSLAIFKQQQLSSNLVGSDEAKYDFLMHDVLTKLEAIEETFYFVLDDYHFIHNRQIHQMLVQFIERLPRNVHLFIITRTRPPFPLAQWHSKQWVQEILTKPLKFTVHETKKYVAHKTTWHLTYDEAKEITERTAGCVATLQLYSLHETNPAINAQQYFVNRFLIEEIIHRLPEEIQQFLFKTSILQQLEPDFCEHVTGIKSSADILQLLEERGLFTNRIHYSQLIYRYHHLFQDALQQQLHKRYTKDEIRHLAHRAASIYETTGDYRSAIEIGLVNGLYEDTQRWLKMYLRTFLLHSEIDTFQRWLEELSTHLDCVDIELLIVGFCHAMTQRQVERANHYMKILDARQQVDQWMEQPENEAISAIYIQTKVYYYIAIVGDNNAAMNIAMRQITPSFTLRERELFPMSCNAGEYTLLRTPLARQGKVPTIHEFHAILNLFLHSPYKDLYVSKFGVVMMAEVYVERMAPQKAISIIEMMYPYAISQKDDSLIVPLLQLKTSMLKDDGQLANAIGVLQHGLELVQDPYWKSIIHILLADCTIEEGQLEQASLKLQTYKLNNPLWSFVQCKLLLKQQQPEEALKIVSYVKERAVNETQIFTEFEAMVYETLCHLAMENMPLALKSFERALAISSKHYYARTILQHAHLQTLLAQIQAENKDDDSLPPYFNWLHSIYKTCPTTQQ